MTQSRRSGIRTRLAAAGLALAACPAPLAAAPRPDPADGRGGFFAFGDFLYMRVTDGMPAYAAVDQDAADLLNQGDNIKLRRDFSPGMRAGLGYAFSEQDFDLRVIYSRLDYREDSSVAQPTGGQVVATLPPRDATLSIADAAEASLRVALRTVDLEAGRAFQPWRSGSLRAFAALRYANLRYAYGATYFGRDFFATGSRTLNLSRFEGFGPRLGFDARVGSKIWFGVLTSVSVLNGRCISSYAQEQTVTFRGFEQREASRKMLPVLDGGLGLGVEPSFGRAQLGIAALYEFQQWMNFISPLTVANGGKPRASASSPDLMIDGLSLRVTARF